MIVHLTGSRALRGGCLCRTRGTTLPSPVLQMWPALWHYRKCLAQGSHGKQHKKENQVPWPQFTQHNEHETSIFKHFFFFFLARSFHCAGWQTPILARCLAKKEYLLLKHGFNGNWESWLTGGVTRENFLYLWSEKSDSAFISQEQQG